MSEHRLMTGVLVWPRGERESDRYSCVTIHPERTPKCRYEACNSLAGRSGTLLARVLMVAQSNHCGDLARGYDVPLRGQRAFPKVGEDIELGSGRLFVAPRPERELLSVGIEDGLDPRNLYRCHWQLVTVWFRPDEGE